MARQLIFIMTDTQNTDMVGCYGNPDMRTPALDRLAADGIRFTKAYTVQPVCGPARSAIFTGLYPHTNGSYSNCIGLEAGVKHVGQRLRHEGIRTAYIGKWHLDGGDYFGRGVCPEGWDPDYWYDMRNYMEELTLEERVRSRNRDTIQEGEGYAPSFTYGYRCSERAIDFLKNRGEEDFLLVVSYDEPHDPYLAPRKYADSYQDYILPDRENYYDSLEDKPEHHRLWAREALKEDRDGGYRRKEPLYLGANTFIDQEIGRVLDACREYAPEALLMYTADHGAMLGAHRLEEKGPAVYEEITRVPFFLAGKPVKAKNCVNHNPISHIDIVPTILAYFNGFHYPFLTGKSLLPLLEEGTGTINDEIYMEFGRYEAAHDYFGGFQPLRCIFDGRYKLAVNLLSSDELYDLEEDPREMHNLIAVSRTEGIRDRLHDRLLDWMNRTRDPFRGYYWEQRPWRKFPVNASWNGDGMTRQKEADYDEVKELQYITGLPVSEAVYQVCARDAAYDGLDGDVR